jgi:hypothetical protein
MMMNNRNDLYARKLPNELDEQSSSYCCFFDYKGQILHLFKTCQKNSMIEDAIY